MKNVCLSICIWLACFASGRAQMPQSWNEAKQAGKGEIVAHFYDNRPFVWGNSAHDIQGIEYELMEEFVKYVRENLHVDLKVSYQKAPNFKALYQTIKNQPNANQFGICSFSITAQRKKEVRFTHSYMLDYELIVSSQNVPNIENQETFLKTFGGLTALSVHGTTYEENLKALKNILPDMKIENCESSGEIRERLKVELDKFGYVELPAYLLDIKEGAKYNRQKFYKMQRDGYGICMPLHSDWIEAWDFFFKSPTFKVKVDLILKKYFGKDVDKTIMSIVSDADANDLDKEIRLLKKEKEIQTLHVSNRDHEIKEKNLELQQQQFYKNIMVLGILFLVVIAGVYYNSDREKKKTNKILTAKNEEIMAQNEEIMRQQKEIIYQKEQILASISYAQRIQEATLPADNEIKVLFPEFFVFFRPRDIVSGDFYYFKERAGKIIVAAIDCTGHGVPGAFMSLVGNGLLTEIIVNRGVTDVDIILNRLHKGIRNILKQESTQNRDGMDLALVNIDRNDKTMQFAGAKNPLVYIQNGEIVHLKGEKMTIGGEQREAERIFSKQIIDISAPTYVYLFSDGYIDQFGGANRQKFRVTTLKSLLLEIHQKPFEEQHNIIEETILAWMAEKNEFQIDDMLVIGFKI